MSLNEKCNAIDRKRKAEVHEHTTREAKLPKLVAGFQDKKNASEKTKRKLVVVTEPILQGKCIKKFKNNHKVARRTSSSKEKGPSGNASHSNMKSSDDSRDSRIVFIGNIPANFKKKQLLKLAKKYGNVERMWVRGIKFGTGKISKKMAYIKKLLPQEHPPLIVHVLFESESDARNALNLNGHKFDNQRLRVTLSQTKSYDQKKGVFIGNLPLNVKEDDMYEMFTKCGEILGVRIIRDANTGVGKGFGYVNFVSSDAVELAVKLDGERFQDRELRIERLFNKKKMKKWKQQNEKSRIYLKHKANVSKKPENESYALKNPLKFNNGKRSKSKKMSKDDLKKKIIAKKLTANRNKKPIESVNSK